MMMVQVSKWVTYTVNTLTANTSIIPDTVGGADIGSTSKEFGDVFIADDKAIKFGNDQDATIEYDEDGDDQLKIGGKPITFTNAVIGKTDTDTSNSGSVTLDFDANQNFTYTYRECNTCKSNHRKSWTVWFIVCIQDGTGSRTLSLGTDYESVGGSGLTLTASATDIIPYVIVLLIGYFLVHLNLRLVKEILCPAKSSYGNLVCKSMNIR